MLAINYTRQKGLLCIVGYCEADVYLKQAKEALASLG